LDGWGEESAEVDVDDLEHCRMVALKAASLAGAQLARSFRSGTKFNYKRPHTDPVSEADRASESLIVEYIGRHRPHDRILAEEGGDHVTDGKLRWVVDPLDGTVNYLQGIPFWCVSISCERWCVDQWWPVIGVVFDPTHEELFWSAEGAGAFLNRQRLTVSKIAEMRNAVIATGYAYDLGHREAQAAMMATLITQVSGIRMLGSTALAMCWVAAGRFGAYFEDRAARWDWSAASLIAREAGASVTPLGTGMLTAAPRIFDDMLKHVGVVR
jgi:fructose-1,6-bisphosphatase/inositol monophosphatase family enzyme